MRSVSTTIIADFFTLQATAPRLKPIGVLVMKLIDIYTFVFFYEKE